MEPNKPSESDSLEPRVNELLTPIQRRCEELQISVENLQSQLTQQEKRREKTWWFEVLQLSLVTTVVLGAFLVLYNMFPSDRFLEDLEFFAKAQQNTVQISLASDATSDSKPPSNIQHNAYTGAFAGEDLIKIVVPVMVLIFTILLSTSGLKRFEGFDRNIEELRQSLQEQMMAERKLAQEARHQYAQEANAQFKSFEHLIGQVAKEALDEAVEDKTEALQKQYNTFDTKVKKHLESVKGYDWLEKFQESSHQIKRMASIGQAHNLVVELLSPEGNSKKQIDLALQIQRQILEDKIKGDPNDFHNLAAEYARSDLFVEAFQVAQLGLQYFKNDIDLNADALHYANKAGDIQTAQNQYDILCELAWELWNWRAFVFAEDYLFGQGRFEEAVELNKQFRSHLPEDERSYSNIASYYYSKGDLKRAYELALKGTQNCARAGQCWGKLTQIYFQRGELEEALSASCQAESQLADDQPGVSRAYFFWQKAAIFDEMVVRQLNAGDFEEREIQDLLIECFAYYRALPTQRAVSAHWLISAKERMSLLRTLLHSKGLDHLLPEDKEPSSNHGGLEQMLQQLQRLQQDSDES
ncbi:MAG: hypothetical protein RRB13_10030 [bacterium]|nr:hypothetical protein [bacterium]